MNTTTLSVVFVLALVTSSLAGEGDQRTVNDCHPIVNDVNGKVEIACEDIDNNTSPPVSEIYTSKSPSATVTVQQTEGFCSPIVSHVGGNVTIQCKGLNPKIMKVLNDQLAKTKRTIAEKVAEANLWIERYNELKEQMAKIQASLTIDAKQRQKSELAFKALENGELEKAGKLLDQVLIKEDYELARKHSARSHIYELQANYPKALKHSEIASKLAPDNLHYGFDLAYIHMRLGQEQQAKSLLLALVPRLKDSAKSDPSQYLPLVARALNNLGNILMTHEKSYEGASQYFRDSLSEYSTLSNTDYVRYASESSGTHANLASTLMALGKWTDAVIELRWAEGLARLGAQVDPELHNHELAGILRNKGETERYFGQYSESVMAMEEALKLFQQLADKEPRSYSSQLANTYAGLARSYVEMNEFEKAFVSYEKAGELYQSLRDSEPNSLQKESSNVHKKLAEFAFVYKHDVPKAIKFAEISMASYETLFEKNEVDLDLMAEAAETAAFLGEMYYSTHEYQHALYHYAQSYRWYKNLHQKSPAAYKDQFAALLYNYAVLAFTGKLGSPVQGCGFVDEALGLQPSEKIGLSLRKLDDLCKRSG